MSLLTIEVEYVVISKNNKEMIWLKNFLKEIGKEHDSGILFNDSQNVTCLAKNQVFHSRTKHI